MSVIAPPRRRSDPMLGDELEALIKEARLRQKRRRIRGAIGLLTVVALVAAGYGIDRSLTAPSSARSADSGALAGVPLDIGSPASGGFGGANVTPVTLSVARQSDGSASASCHTENG